MCLNKQNKLIELFSLRDAGHQWDSLHGPEQSSQA